MTDRQSTHGHDCWSWGPKHYECAVREIERLRKMHQDAYQRGLQAGSKGLREMYDAVQAVKRQDAWGNAQLTEALMEAEERAERAEAENKRLHEQLRLATVDQAIAEAEANDALEAAREEVAALRKAVDRAWGEGVDFAMDACGWQEGEDPVTEGLYVARDSKGNVEVGMWYAKTTNSYPAEWDRGFRDVDRDDIVAWMAIPDWRAARDASKLSDAMLRAREVERLREDAARYRWLRDREIPEWLDLWHQNPDRIDAAIDQARGKEVRNG